MKLPRCACPDCARLDLAFPGEGIQLALLPATKPRKRRRRLADIEDEAFRRARSPGQSEGRPDR